MHTAGAVPAPQGQSGVIQVLQQSSMKLELWKGEGQCVFALSERDSGRAGIQQFSFSQDVHRLQYSNAPREVDFAGL